MLKRFDKIAAYLLPGLVLLLLAPALGERPRRGNSSNGGGGNTRVSRPVTRAPVNRPAPTQRAPVSRPAPTQRTQVNRPAPTQRTQVNRPAPTQRTQVNRPAPTRRTQVNRPAQTQRTQVNRPSPAQNTQARQSHPAMRNKANRPNPAGHVQVNQPNPDARSRGNQSHPAARNKSNQPNPGPAIKSNRSNPAARNPIKGQNQMKRTQTNQPNAGPRTKDHRSNPAADNRTKRSQDPNYSERNKRRTSGSTPNSRDKTVSTKRPTTWPSTQSPRRSPNATQTQSQRDRRSNPSSDKSVRRPVTPNSDRDRRSAPRRPVNPSSGVSGTTGSNNVTDSYNNYNINYNYANPQPVYNTARNIYIPAYSHTRNYNPYQYVTYRDRRTYRRSYFNQCSVPFLLLGFFFSRPYSSYDYSYNQPYYYGSDDYYESVMIGGPTELASELDMPPFGTPQLESPEARMLASVSRYVEQRSPEGSFLVADPSEVGGIWLLELAQAPAVFEIEDGLYSVIAGFEGTLNNDDLEPSDVTVEFFVARTADGYDVREAWITSVDETPREPLYQSPVYPEIKTWQPGTTCPFTGQPMVPIYEETGVIPSVTTHG